MSVVGDAAGTASNETALVSARVIAAMIPVRRSGAGRFVRFG